MEIVVSSAELTDPQVQELVTLHQQNMFDISPPGTSFALDMSGLSGPGISLYGAWDGVTLITVGALKRLSPDHAEIKSMRTRPDYLGRGAAKLVLEKIIDVAQSEGFSRLSLETGTSKEFGPAIGLYTKRGFAAGDAFAGYENGPHNQCYHLVL